MRVCNLFLIAICIELRKRQEKEKGICEGSYYFRVTGLTPTSFTRTTLNRPFYFRSKITLITNYVVFKYKNHLIELHRPLYILHSTSFLKYTGYGTHDVRIVSQLVMFGCYLMETWTKDICKVDFKFP